MTALFVPCTSSGGPQRICIHEPMQRPNEVNWDDSPSVAVMMFPTWCIKFIVRFVYESLTNPASPHFVVGQERLVIFPTSLSAATDVTSHKAECQSNASKDRSRFACPHSHASMPSDMDVAFQLMNHD